MNYQLPVINRLLETQRLEEIAAANWSYDYLSSEGQVKSRCAFWRVVQWLKLDQLPWIGNCFPKVDLQEAAKVINASIKNIAQLDDVGITEETKMLFREVADKVNILFDHINSKRGDDNQIPQESYIQVPGNGNSIFDTITNLFGNNGSEDANNNTPGSENTQTPEPENSILHTITNLIGNNNTVVEAPVDTNTTPPIPKNDNSIFDFIEHLIDSDEDEEIDDPSVVYTNKPTTNEDQRYTTITPKRTNIKRPKGFKATKVGNPKPKQVAHKHQKRLTKEQLLEMNNNKQRGEIVEIEKDDK